MPQQKQLSNRALLFSLLAVLAVLGVFSFGGIFEPSEAQKAAHFVENFDTQDHVTK